MVTTLTQTSPALTPAGMKAVRKVASILSKRDGENLEDMIELVMDTLEEVNDYVEAGMLLETYEVWQDNLGLEPDYLEEIIFATR